MGKKYIIQLLQRYLKGESTTVENDFLHSYYDLFQNETDILSNIDTRKKQMLKKEIFKAIQQNIAEQDNTAVKVKKVRTPLLQVAASVLIVSVFTLVLFVSGKSSSLPVSTAELYQKMG